MAARGFSMAGGRGIGMMSTGGFLMMLVMIAFIVLAVLGIIVLIKYLRGSPQHHAEKMYGRNIPGDNSLNILNERYAKGEISTEEYATAKAELKK